MAKRILNYIIKIKNISFYSDFKKTEYKHSSFNVRAFAGRLRKRPSLVIAITIMVYSLSDLSIVAWYSWSVPE